MPVIVRIGENRIQFVVAQGDPQFKLALYGTTYGNMKTVSRSQRKQKYYHTRGSMKSVDSVDIIVPFLMDLGIKILLNELQNVLKWCVHIRMLPEKYR